ncbi:MAG: ribonuclease HII [Acidimicrobiia bacterium]
MANAPATIVQRRPMAAAARRAPVPSTAVERDCFGAGARIVVGIDEVGRGAWAGPVSVGVVAMTTSSASIRKVRDSKALTPEEREMLFPRITAWALGWAVGHASPVECDGLGMTTALRLAGGRALAGLAGLGWELGPAGPGASPECRGLGLSPEMMFILDGNYDYLGLGNRVRLVVGGDAKCLSVAAASVVAKVTRDRLMAAEAECYPAYDFDSNRGYPSPGHKRALAGYGPSAIHRRSWIFMEHLPWGGPRSLPGDCPLPL